jgi:hypothetical protein
MEDNYVIMFNLPCVRTNHLYLSESHVPQTGNHLQEGIIK